MKQKNDQRGGMDMKNRAEMKMANSHLCILTGYSWQNEALK